MATRSRLVQAAACALLLLLPACGADQGDNATKPASSAVKSAGGAKGPTAAAPSARDVALKSPGRLSAPLLSPDVLIAGQKTLDAATIARIKKLDGVVDVEPISMGQFFVDEQEVTYAAVDPASFRRFTTPGTAQTAAVWARVADGEIAAQPALAKKLQSKDGFLRIGNGTDAQRIHIGAYAQLLDPAWARQIDAVVNYKWVETLGLKSNNALLVSTGSRSPQKLRAQLQKDAGTASVQILGPNLDTSVPQNVVLTGGSVASAVGSFSYRVIGGGRVAPDPKWVATYIRTEQMPIIGSVTGNKVMLPRLQQALLEVVREGLSKSIYHYDGCYVPRFIAGTNTLSFHSFGTAIDLNASDNQRGTVGKMDRRVVRIFERWGFDWGGTWHYTDPMHFELASLVPVP